MTDSQEEDNPINGPQEETIAPPEPLPPAPPEEVAWSGVLSKPEEPWSYRHSFPVRLSHWINVLCIPILVLSGLQIFNAHPALYWGSAPTGTADPIDEGGAGALRFSLDKKGWESLKEIGP